MRATLVLWVISGLAVLVTFGAAGVLTAIALACGVGTSPTCAWEDGE